MLDGWFCRSNFYTKCKSALKMINVRMDEIMKRRNALLNISKKDIADLLNDHFDYNAYSRVERLYMDLNLTSCYNYVEECCRCIADHLKEMHKQSECPDECKIAVASVIYAAARFANLPELRNLRDLLIKKYGTDLDPFLNKEFAEKLRSAPPTRKMKLELMQEIAQEFSIQWDPISLEQKLSSDPKDTTISDDADQKLPRSRSVNVPCRKERQNHGAKLEENVDEGSLGRQHYKSTHTKGLGISKSNVEKKSPSYEKKPFPDRYAPAAPRAEEPTGLSRGIDVAADQTDRTPRDKNCISGVDREGKSKPKSMRQRFLKKLAQVDASHGSPCVESSKTRESPPTGLGQDKSDVDDPEESMLDRLLFYYSKKRSPKSTPENREDAKVQKSSHGQEEYMSRPQKPELPLPPGRRTLSSAGEVELFPSADSDNRGMHSRAASLDGIGHVHPRMPDNYRELAHRIAALRNKPKE